MKQISREKFEKRIKSLSVHELLKIIPQKITKTYKHGRPDRGSLYIRCDYDFDTSKWLYQVYYGYYTCGGGDDVLHYEEGEGLYPDSIDQWEQPLRNMLLRLYDNNLLPEQKDDE